MISGIEQWDQPATCYKLSVSERVRVVVAVEQIVEADHQEVICGDSTLQ